MKPRETASILYFTRPISDGMIAGKGGAVAERSTAALCVAGFSDPKQIFVWPTGICFGCCCLCI